MNIEIVSITNIYPSRIAALCNLRDWLDSDLTAHASVDMVKLHMVHRYTSHKPLRFDYLQLFMNTAYFTGVSPSRLPWPLPILEFVQRWIVNLDRLQRNRALADEII